jgi:hypothetical protein
VIDVKIRPGGTPLPTRGTVHVRAMAGLLLGGLLAASMAGAPGLTATPTASAAPAPDPTPVASPTPEPIVALPAAEPEARPRVPAGGGSLTNLPK